MPGALRLGLPPVPIRDGFDWYPGVLYQPGDILLWYDPSDLTTMFQDVAGTSPVTADGQSVLLMLDKGQWGGKTLAQVLAAQPELLASASWAMSTGGGTATATNSPEGTLNLTGDGTKSAIGDQSFATVAGRRYKITCDVATNVTALYFGTTQGGTQLATTTFAADSGKTYTFVATGTLSWVRFFRTGAGTTTVSSISLKEIPGYHRVQATPSQAPKYKTGPNPAAAEASPELVTNGTFDTDTTGWTATADAVVTWDASGKLSLERVSNVADRASQAITCTIGRAYRVRGRVEAGTGTSGLRIGTTANGSETAGEPQIVSGAAQNFEFTFIATATTQYVNVTNGTNGTRLFDNISVKEIPASAPYIHWLLYDGTDDGAVTPTINWGTDEVAICAGVTKSSDAAAGCFAELSTNSSTTVGAFGLFAPAAASTTFMFRSRGSTDRIVTLSPYASPRTDVLTAIGDISADRADLRVNGALDAGTPTGSAGTGNFGNHILYFGRRGGSSLPFNGKEHSFVARSRLLSASELAKLEAFTAAKTGVIL